MKCTELSYIKKTYRLPDAQTINASGLNYKAAFSQYNQHFSCKPQSFPLKARNQGRFSAHAGVVGVGSMTDSPLKWEDFKSGGFGGPTTFVTGFALHCH